MQLDLSADYLVWDNVQSVTFSSSRDTGPVTSRVTTAKVRALNLHELTASQGVYQAGDVSVLIPAVLLTPVPKMADQVITDDGQVLTALAVDGWKRDQSGQPRTWKLVCRNLAIALQLNDLIDVQRAALTYDPAGSVVRHWPDGNAPGVDAGGSTPYPQISARVQLLTKEEADERGLRGLRENYSVIIDRQVLLTGQDRLRWVPVTGGGVVYLDILALRNPQRIDELPVIDAARVL